MPAPVHLVQGIQINDQTADRLLKYVNPIFADVVSVSGDRQLRPAAVGDASGRRCDNAMELTGTLSIDKLQLGASNILNQILSVGRQVHSRPDD